MLDNELIQIFLPIIKTELISRGYPDVVVKQSYQPTLQGAETAPTIYFFKIDDYVYGSPKVSALYTEGNPPLRNRQILTQWYETRFQFSAWVKQNPENISYTASDLVNAVCAILQDNYVVYQLLQFNVSVLRVTNIRNPLFKNDSDVYEASPSFDITFTQQQITQREIPATKTATASGIYPI